MADDKQDLELEEEGGKKGKGKLIIIIAILLVLGGGGGAAFFLMGGEEETSETAEASEDDAEEEAAAAKEPPIYVGVPEAIISPIKGKRKERLVQIKMSFMVRGASGEEAVKKHMPRLKNDLLSLVSRAQADELIKPDGRHKLQEDSLQVVRDAMKQLEGKEYVEKVLFVSFVMQ